MKRIRSNKAKVLRNVLISISSLVILYFAAGCPSLSSELRIQLTEKQAMVGPSTIVDHLDNQEYGEFRDLYVGETEYGITFYAMKGMKSGYFSYCSKTGDMTLLAAPTYGDSWRRQTEAKSLPVYLFHEYPTAARAEVDLTVIGDPSDPYYTWEAFTKEYHLEATAEQDNFFLFYIHVPQADETGTTELGAEGSAPQLFSRICHSKAYSTGSQKAYATVRLYDESGDLLIEKALTILSLSDSVDAEN